MKYWTVGVCVALLASATTFPSHGAIRMGCLFKDHMVVQQGTKLPVWGWAEPGGDVSIMLAGRKEQTTAHRDGSWLVRLKPVEVGGPLALVVTTATDTVTINDVLAGEVWICSGQSNMEWPVELAANAEEEIAAANWPGIRMFTVEHATSAAQLDTCHGSWWHAESTHVGHFSAVGYYFGRALGQALSSPVGLIHTSWGGSTAEAWAMESTIRSDKELAPILVRTRESRRTLARERAEYAKLLTRWEKRVSVVRDAYGRLPSRHTDSVNLGAQRQWAALEMDDASWDEIALPGRWEQTGSLDIDGAVWFRKQIDIPEDWQGKDLMLTLGALDDFDITYWNGVEVGRTGEETPKYWQAPRRYTVPASAVRTGRAMIAVRIFDRWGGGGFGGTAEQMMVQPVDSSGHTPVALAGPWKYLVERELPPLMPPPAPAGVRPHCEPGALFNAMLHPLVPYAVRGAIWYQGESNAGRAYQYRTLLPAMIADWRSAWKRDDLPFGVVQLANFGKSDSTPSASTWAELREAQMMTAKADTHTGLVTAIDIGEADDIHPKNKQEVGRRLSLWALASLYGRDTAFSGPVYSSMKIKDNKAILSFEHTDGGLVVEGDSLMGFSIAGPDSQFVWARAKVRGEQVVVWSDEVDEPVAVRYAWANNPVCNLYNGVGLPALPLRTDSWPGATFGKK